VSRAVGLFVVVAVVLLAGSAVLSRWAPVPPSDAGSTIAMRTTLAGDAAPDPSDGVDPNTVPPIPTGAGCTTVSRPAGSMYLCWTATRDMADADPVADYYRLRVLGTVNAESGSGVRWVAISARLDGQPSNNVFKGWPDSTVTGPCQDYPVDLLVAKGDTETLCGETVGTTDVGRWKHTVTWACTGCLLPDRDAVGIVLHEEVAMPEGTLPTWEIGADMGG
jgi:hypothetical protein